VRIASSTGGFGNVVRALSIRNYRIYTLGNTISLIGIWLQRVAVGWLAWRLTHSGTWLGLVAFADLAPVVFLSPVAGALADRRDRVWVIRMTQVVAISQALLLAVLTVTGLITIWSLFLLTLVLGAANAIAQPARLALIPSLVDRESLPSAVAINSIVFNNARFIGPAIAGIAIAQGSVSLGFVLNALAYMAFSVCLSRVTVASESSARLGGRSRILSETLEGYLYALKHPGIGPMLGMFALSSVVCRGFIEMLPGFADSVFHRGPQGLAWMVATAGLGAMLGGVWMVVRNGIEGLTDLLVTHMLLISAALLAFTATTEFWVALPCLFIAGAGLVVTGVSAQTLVQSAVDPAMRGRIMGLYGMIFRGGPALNSLLIGLLSSEFGLRLPLAGGAALAVLLWAWGRWHRGQMAMALEAEPQGAPAD
jgi:predicted MFS family arabinose efflux permease